MKRSILCKVYCFARCISITITCTPRFLRINCQPVIKNLIWHILNEEFGTSSVKVCSNSRWIFLSRLKFSIKTGAIGKIYSSVKSKVVHCIFGNNAVFRVRIEGYHVSISCSGLINGKLNLNLCPFGRSAEFAGMIEAIFMIFNCTAGLTVHYSAGRRNLSIKVRVEMYGRSA